SYEDTRTLLKKFGLQDHFRLLQWTLPDDQKSLFTVPSEASLDCLPDMIESNDDPEIWKQNWIDQWQFIITSEEDQFWLKSRLQMLLSGYKGLSNTCLADTLLTIPPLRSALEMLLQSLFIDRRGALFNPAGTGKSRKLLYLAALWKKKHPAGEILFCDSPSLLTIKKWA
ncbi:MAG: hypothetical protein ACFFBD_30280, partial [Candidatus Hodarchaeota archaeon]